jgi:hypothetical protein
MTKRALREKFAANFETALLNAGMQYFNVDDDKPKFWRGEVTNVDDIMFLLYSVTEPVDTDYADNDLFRQQLFIDGRLFTRNGFGDSDFQDLGEEIETQCNALGIMIKWTGEGSDTSLDTESPIYYIEFEAQQRLLK